MSDILDYIDWRGDLSFKKSKLNEVDVVILSQIAMLDLNKSVPKHEGATLKSCAEKYFKIKTNNKKIGFIIPEQINTLFAKMADSARFSGLILSDYVEDIDESIEVQFSALTAYAHDINTLFVIFSGTDDTIVGWKENFNLIYKTPTGAQIQSVKYLEKVSDGFDGKIVVLGHSKGGHLAIYSAANCKQEIADKIYRTVNLDGPGIPDTEEEHARFAAGKKKMVTILPQSSIIGRLFEHSEDFYIVHSNAKGLFQHDCFSWEVKGVSLVRDREFTEVGTGIDAGVRKLLSDMNAEEREKFVDGLFGMLFSTSCSTLTELSGHGRDVVKAYFKMDGENKKTVNRTLLKMLSNKYMRRCILETTRELKNLNRTPEDSAMQIAAGAEENNVNKNLSRKKK